jgi:hypothetical protein
MPESYWDHIAKAYESVSIYDGPKVLAADLKKHPPHIIDLLAAHWFLSEMSNGGIAQFYLNSTAVLAPESASAFANMGLPVVADSVKKSLAVFGSSYPRDEEERVAALLRVAKKKDPEDLFESNLFSDIEAAIYDFGGNDLGRIYDRMDAYAKEKKG